MLNSHNSLAVYFILFYLFIDLFFLKKITSRPPPKRQEHCRMMGAPDEAQFLGWLCATSNARKVIEVGVFRGSTTLALALALPEDAKIVGLDISDAYVQLGRQAWKDAGVEDKIDLRIGDATKLMADMVADASEVGTYDFVFIDADKLNYDTYYEHALTLLRKGGVIAVDNVLWGGRVTANPPPSVEEDPDTRAIILLNQKIRADKRVHAVMLPIADGCYMVRKL